MLLRSNVKSFAGVWVRYKVNISTERFLFDKSVKSD